MNDKAGVGRGMHDAWDVLWLDCKRRSQEAGTFNSDLRQPSASFQIVWPEHGDRAVIDKRKVRSEIRAG